MKENRITSGNPATAETPFRRGGNADLPRLRVLQGVPRSSHVPAGPGCQQDGCGEDKGRLRQMASWLARVKTPRNVTCIG